MKISTLIRHNENKTFLLLNQLYPYYQSRTCVFRTVEIKHFSSVKPNLLNTVLVYAQPYYLIYIINNYELNLLARHYVVQIKNISSHWFLYVSNLRDEPTFFSVFQFFFFLTSNNKDHKIGTTTSSLLEDILAITFEDYDFIFLVFLCVWYELFKAP